MSQNASAQNLFCSCPSRACCLVCTGPQACFSSTPSNLQLVTCAHSTACICVSPHHGRSFTEFSEGVDQGLVGQLRQHCAPISAGEKRGSSGCSLFASHFICCETPAPPLGRAVFLPRLFDCLFAVLPNEEEQPTQFSTRSLFGRMLL